ncbi:hypothetical protein BKA80DRAFT_100002 [Phyllosticta citrichinensis]
MVHSLSPTSKKRAVLPPALLPLQPLPRCPPSPTPYDSLRSTGPSSPTPTRSSESLGHLSLVPQRARCKHPRPRLKQPPKPQPPQRMSCRASKALPAAAAAASERVAPRSHRHPCHRSTLWPRYRSVSSAARAKRAPRPRALSRPMRRRRARAHDCRVL